MEENLRLAKNLQTILGEAQTIAKPEAKIPAKTGPMAIVKPETTATEAKGGWRIENIQISNHFNDNERHEIMNTFGSSRQINQDDLLKSAYQIYSRVGISLHFIIHPKDNSAADLEILLGQREDNANSYFTFFTPMTPGQFKSERFSITVNK